MLKCREINETDDHPLMGSKIDMFTMEGVTLQGVPLVYGVLQTKIAKIVTIL